MAVLVCVMFTSIVLYCILSYDDYQLNYFLAEKTLETSYRNCDDGNLMNCSERVITDLYHIKLPMIQLSDSY